MMMMSSQQYYAELRVSSPSAAVGTIASTRCAYGGTARLSRRQ